MTKQGLGDKFLEVPINKDKRPPLFYANSSSCTGCACTGTAPKQQARSSYIPPVIDSKYEKIIKWVEDISELQSAYKTPEAKAAYIKSLGNEPASTYDTLGLLRSLGITETRTFSRDSISTAAILDHVRGYRPTKTVRLLMKPLQKGSVLMWKRWPKRFYKMTSDIDHRFLLKEKVNEPWRPENTPIPQPPIQSGSFATAEEIHERYKDTIVAKCVLQENLVSRPAIKKSWCAGNEKLDRERMTFWFKVTPAGPQIQRMFMFDLHLGGGAGGPYNVHAKDYTYGTYALARSIGLTKEQAERIGAANLAVDRNNTPYGRTNWLPYHNISRHFNAHYDNPSLGDTRLFWTVRHLNAAVTLAKHGRFDQAEKELGYGLHSLQDAFSHGQLSPSVHIILGEIPDLVNYNPIAVSEASAATIKYLKTYLRRILEF